MTHHCYAAMQSPAGRFLLNGEEIELGVGPQASMAHRVEALRVLLEQRLGFDTFMKYALLPKGQPSPLPALLSAANQPVVGME